MHDVLHDIYPSHAQVSQLSLLQESNAMLRDENTRNNERARQSEQQLQTLQGEHVHVSLYACV